MNVNTVNAKTEHRRVNDHDLDANRRFARRICRTCLSYDYHALGCPHRCKCGECEIADNNEIAEQMIEIESCDALSALGFGLYLILIIDKQRPKVDASFTTFEAAREYALANYTRAQKPMIQYVEIEP